MSDKKAELRRLMVLVDEAADGDSNDAEIEVLREALGVALEIINGSLKEDVQTPYDPYGDVKHRYYEGN